MQIEIEIGENLFLRIENIIYTPPVTGYTSGRPEDCYPDEGAEVDFYDYDCFLVFKTEKPKLFLIARWD